MDDKTELALTHWFNSFSGDHGKTEWEALVEIVIAALTRERKAAEPPRSVATMNCGTSQ